MAIEMAREREVRKDLEQQVNALKYLEGIQEKADQFELQIEQLRQQESAVNERSKRVDKRESETLAVLQKKINDLENQLNNLMVENERLEKLVKDLKANEKAMQEKQTVLESEL